jgi:cbb3-type cytochrome oxidase maturation protein
MSATLTFILVTLLMGLAAWLALMWAVSSGQFKDVERPKHRMLEEDELDGDKKQKDERA